jgi:tetratricopeptide (TPR) repeat protein
VSVGQSTDPKEPTAVSAAEVRRLLASDPPAAEARAREILKARPQNVDALLVLGAALRRQGKGVEAKAIFESIVATQPDFAFALLELGLTLGLLGNHTAARDALARAVDLSPTFVSAWCALADELARPEDGALARPLDNEPANCMQAADAAIEKRDFAEAEAVLARGLELSPQVQVLQFRYAIVLLAEGKAHLALPVIEELIHRDWANSFYGELRASALCEVGDFRAAIAQYEALLGDGRQRPGAWISYGRALRAIGRQEECLAAFRKAIEILPAFAEGYRTLATVKTTPLAPESIDHIRGLLERPGLLTATRAQLHFALAKALEDTERYDEAFENYARSQEFQGTGVIGTGRKFHDFVQQLKAVFTREYFYARSGRGCNDNGPIFVVGMPRSGSTLLQEILAAHPSIERTGELQDLNATVAGLHHGAEPGRRSIPQHLASLGADRLKSLGSDYLNRTRPRRRRGLPFFVDKLPGNFIYTGLIHLILPNAKIVDMRRHPLDCCVSCFTNYFPQAPVWSHSLDDLGHYYVGYVELMAHFDELLPGRIHRVIYEQLIEDPERQVRRLLSYLDLPYDEQCLRFYETEQAILTTSVEQARRPINRSGAGGSRKFEPWLGQLKTPLARVLDAYPATPQFRPELRGTTNMRVV